MEEGKAEYWWLRSPGSFNLEAVIVYKYLNERRVDIEYYGVYNDEISVRPAMWIDLGF